MIRTSPFSGIKASVLLAPSQYPYEKEQELITKVKTGDSVQAKALLNELLGYVFFAEGNNLEVIKTRAIELCSLLSRAAIEGGATNDTILKLNNHFLKNLQEIQNLDDLCYKLQEVLDAFTANMFDYIPAKNHEIIKKAIQYISRHFTENLTLEEVAGHVHLNAAYFSSMFKQSTGSSFKEYLNMVRVEESKRLLANTDYTIVDIAIAAGFEDQSYFPGFLKRNREKSWVYTCRKTGSRARMHGSLPFGRSFGLLHPPYIPCNMKYAGAAVGKILQGLTITNKEDLPLRFILCRSP